ncbi:DUF6105 family protein [Lentilitoribacter sp. Alg239-R112]|uniref:DUF6105 family protein n=1 Tax=Lentilitoribacter sp. Alg239-R112 TaxID=2305987 RepID=UPI0013A6B3CE|nr:DUF6105 family protein [Lentilitoribacter sp. Alg239-R112]
MAHRLYKGSALKYLLIFWGVPVGAVAAWYYLSINDINFGLLMFSRVFNDAVFDIYGNILGMDAQAVRDLLIRTFVIDTLFIAAIIYFKPFRRIKEWWESRRRKSEANHLVEATFDDHHVGSANHAGLSPLKENNLSSAP